MGVNKVTYGNETLIDLTSDTVTPRSLTLGATAHDSDGESIVGEYEAPQADWNETDTSSPSYIKNKPTIFQTTQADWNETDTTAQSYIQNKPTNLVSKSSVSLTINVAGWSDKSYSVVVPGVTATNDVIISPTTASRDDYINAGIWCANQNTNFLRFTCEQTPTTAITVNILILT